jgi:hypothetical protein
VNLFRFIPGYEPHIHETGREPLFLLLLAFLIAFVLTRAYTREARRRGWGSGNVGGVHLHHMVPGILLMIGTGLLVFAFDPESWRYDLAAIVFGVGAALTLDEFALVFRLDDVYWSNEGRSSIDAVVTLLLFGGLCLVASSPFGAQNDLDDRRLTFFVVIAVHVALSVICLLKGKLTLGALGLVFPLIALVGAVRLAKPSSIWARWFYREDGGRVARWNRVRAIQRAEAHEHTWAAWRDRLFDLIGGAPSKSGASE